MKSLFTLPPKASTFFKLEKEKIKFLSSPSEFASTLQSLITQSHKRIFMSSLYMGDGIHEKSLIDSIRTQQEKHEELKVHLHFDWNRSMRPPSILPSLPSTIPVSLYKHPINSVLNRFLSPSLQECFSVSHCKFFLFDNVLLMSGANLSKDYFEKRMDRWMMIENCGEEIIDYYCSLVKLLKDISINGIIRDKSKNMLCEAGKTKAEINQAFKTFYSQTKKTNRSLENYQIQKGETIIVPTLQLGPFGFREDEDVLTHTIRLLPMYPDSEHLPTTLATAYYNPPTRIHKLLKAANVRIITSSPSANSFIHSGPPKNIIPSLYAHSTNMNAKLMQKYEHPTYSWHVKGIWMFDDEENVSLTAIGSSNYNHRSLCRDLEHQLWIFSSGPNKISEAIEADKLRCLDTEYLRRDVIKVSPMIPIIFPFFKSFL